MGARGWSSFAQCCDVLSVYVSRTRVGLLGYFPCRVGDGLGDLASGWQALIRRHCSR